MHASQRRAILLTWAFLASIPLAARAGPNASTAPGVRPSGCLANGNGFLRARIRGALNLDIDWKNAEIECDGSARPNGHGIRLSFAGPKHSDGRRLRMIFGVATTAEGVDGRALPTNLTVIFEGEQRLFSTLGEGRCTVDELHEERVGALGPAARSYRVVARGFCTEPATAVGRNDHILVSRFDFAGRVSFDAAPPQSLSEHPL
jgi:hypothetical protein